jgi:hypothetical protein
MEHYTGAITDIAGVILRYEQHSEHTQLAIHPSWEAEPNLGIQLSAQS